ncbi:hypothetical protein TIFTF001_051948 [Ficus carica]|uniref:Uncharacterized protein n=1 Tax=Ficus carica TaxID=3494 RepID=A0AA88ECF5_FICCA|nr:hypothetical protein TIFTF001_051948 [Ficus carica]
MGKQIQPRQNFEANQKGQPRNFAQGSKQFGRNKRKENSSGQSQQRNYPQKKVARGNEGNRGSFCKELHFEHPRSEFLISQPEPQQPVACCPGKVRRTLDHSEQIRGS